MDTADLAMLPMLTTLQVAARSALPVYARVAQTPERLGAAVAWTARTASLILLAPVLVVFLEGEALFAAIGKVSDPTLLLTVRLLCVCAFFRAAPQFALPALIATGHSRAALVEAVLSSVVLAACIFPSLALFHVPPADVRVAAAWLVACLILVPVELWLMRPLGREVRRQLLASFRTIPKRTESRPKETSRREARRRGWIVRMMASGDERPKRRMRGEVARSRLDMKIL